MPAQNSRIHEMTDEDLDGFSETDLKCRGCSGYGNCGYRMYGIYKGKVLCMCRMRRRQLQCERDGIPFTMD